MVSAIVAVVVVVAVIFSAIALTFFIDRKLNQSAEQQVITFTEQAAAAVADRVFMVQNAIAAFTVQTSDPVQIVPALNALKESNGFANVAFAGLDGEGLYADGTPFSVDELKQPETALSEARQSYSDTFVSSDGVRVRLAQQPLFVDGAQVGALYVQIPLSLFSIPRHLDMFDGRGYFMLFVGSSGEVLVPPSDETLTPVADGASLYDFLSAASRYDSTLPQPAIGDEADRLLVAPQKEDDLERLRDVVGNGQVGLMTLSVDGKPSYVCAAPVDAGFWYVCSVIPIKNVRAEAAVVTTSFELVYVITFACLAIVALLMFAVYRRRVRERNISMLSQLYEALSDSLDLAVNLYSASDGKVTPIVAKAADIIGYRLDDFMKNERLAERIDLSPEGVSLFDRIRAGEVTSMERGEFSFRNKRSGKESWAAFTVKPFMFDDKPQLLVVIRDATADKEIQLSMKDAMDVAEAANAAKSEFLSRMSHEIRTPMNVILGMLHIAKKNVDDPDKVSVDLVKIESASDHLLGLINDVLDISKIENGKMTLASGPFTLGDLIARTETVVRAQCEQRGQELIVTMPTCPDAVFVGDVVRLKQMLINLLTNAVKYTPQGGHIRFETSVSTGAAMGYRQVKFVVADDGIGMSEEFKRHVFEPFAMEGRSREQGTGLGMPIVKNIVTLMAGDISVESALEKGTTFVVTLNLRIALEIERLSFEESQARAQQVDALMEGKDAEPTGDAGVPEESRRDRFESPASSPAARCPLDWGEFSGLRVLLAEDNDLNAEIACELLSEVGLVTDRARDGKEVCELFERSAIGSYDVVLMDVQMPVMNGYEATRCIRALDREDAASVPIIAMSANAFADDVNASLASGMNAHLSKPIDMRRVLATIIKHVRRA